MSNEEIKSRVELQDLKGELAALGDRKVEPKRTKLIRRIKQLEAASAKQPEEAEEEKTE